MSKLLIFDNTKFEVSGGMKLSVNGNLPSKEIDLTDLDRKDIESLKKNPDNKSVLAKIDRIKEERK